MKISNRCREILVDVLLGWVIPSQFRGKIPIYEVDILIESLSSS